MGVAEWAGPLVVAVVESLEVPVGLVFEAVVVPAERREVVFAGGASVCPGLAVVDVAVDGGHAAAGEDTAWGSWR